MSKIQFTVQPRKFIGKKVSQLRREKVVPGNIYGESDSVSIQFGEREFLKLYDQAGETGLVYLSVEGDKAEKPTLIDEVQHHPVNDQILHVSFKQVDLKEKIEAQIPVELVGEFDVREAVLVQVRNEIEVEALPTDLPEKFIVNIERLSEVGQSILLKDLDFDREKISIVGVETAEDWDNPVVIVQEQREEEVEEEVTPDDVEVIGEDEAAAEKADGETEPKHKDNQDEAEKPAGK